MAATSVYDFEALSIEGKPAHLSTQRGKVILIVNTASACGFTPQFAGLENPAYEVWQDEMDAELRARGDPRIVVAHYLGGAALLKYLVQRRQGLPLDGLFLIGTPYT